jgi:hypothetical protein
MKEQFANKKEEREFEDMLISLGYNESHYTDWWKIEQFLWETFTLAIIVTPNIYGKYDVLVDKKIYLDFDSPITAKTEGIKQAVIHLHKQLK